LYVGEYMFVLFVCLFNYLTVLCQLLRSWGWMRYGGVVTSDIRKEVWLSSAFRCLYILNCAVAEVCTCDGIICNRYVSSLLCQRKKEIYLPKLDITCAHILIFNVLYNNWKKTYHLSYYIEYVFFFFFSIHILKHSLPSSAEVKSFGPMPPPPHTSS
jgi:hypothetical protein